MSLRQVPATARVVAAAGRQLSTNLAGEVVILDIEQGVYFGLDGVGTLIWEMLQTPGPVSAIVDRILVEYDVERSAAEADVHALLADLAARGLIEVDAAPGT
jgi:Coenzyme PQQ synthesis protein D (PqqD)